VSQQENLITPTHRNIGDEKGENERWVGRKNAARMSGARLGEIKETSPRYSTGERTDQRSMSTLREHETFADGIIRISLTKPLLNG
jgi:hypothetical protein